MIGSEHRDERHLDPEPRAIPVYTSDGHTVIGQISTGVNVSAAPSTAP